ncbi:unnamed protein product [Ranitomeya imitator]|uniref:NADP-dependent oxidoreductase domain-containing protein n=1 Tax=Ranitomeya imitator TaxID=111125 RepID=A0ABN9MGP7_9NEOB|nr:unnamed protein product [Ranitomeya imitator]
MILNKPGLKHKPVCNQVECHLFLNQSKMLEFCKSRDIALVAYSVLGSSRDETWGIGAGAPVLLEDPVLNTIAHKLGRTPAQVAMRYLLQRGIVVLAKKLHPGEDQTEFTGIRIRAIGEPNHYPLILPLLPMDLCAGAEALDTCILVLDFQLSEEDMTVLHGQNKNLRYDRMEMCEDHPEYPYHDEY